MLILSLQICLIIAASAKGDSFDGGDTSRVLVGSEKNGQFSVPLVPHHVQLERRRRTAAIEEEVTSRHLLHTGSSRRRLDIGEGEDDPLAFVHQVGSLFQGYGTHYVDLWVGTPPQRQTLIVGTGSKYASFPCSECDDCGHTNHIDSYFRDGNSSSFAMADCDSCFRFAQCTTSPTRAVKQCRFSEHYQEGSSWNAFEASDFAYIGGPHDAALPVGRPGQDEDGVNPSSAADFSFRFTFGCQTNIRGLFKTQLADGMLGMCNCDVALWRQMYGAGKLNRQQFSLCFNRQPIPTREGKRAGAFTLGGTDTRLHDNPMKFAALQSDGEFFKVQIQSVTLRKNGGERAEPEGDDSETANFILPHSSGSGILDSGTTDTYLLQGMRSGFENAWKNLMGTRFIGSGNRMHGSTQLSDLPTILFHIEAYNASATGGRSDTITVAFPPSHYMEYDPKTNSYTCRIYFDGGRWSDLGANFLMGHDVMFDMVETRIGFAESECDYEGLVAEDAREQANNGKKNDRPSGGSSGGGSSGGSSGGGSSGAAGGGGGSSTPRKGSAENRKNKGFCTGIGCRFGFFAVALVIGGVIAALVLNPGMRGDLRDRLREIMSPPEQGLYQRTAVEIPMSSIGETELPEVA